VISSVVATEVEHEVNSAVRIPKDVVMQFRFDVFVTVAVLVVDSEVVVTITEDSTVVVEVV